MSACNNTEADGVHGHIAALELARDIANAKIQYTPGGDAMTYEELAFEHGVVCDERDRLNGLVIDLRQQLAAARGPSTALKVEHLVDERVQQWLPVYQYYYKQDNCPALSSGDSNCICWHNEGANPFPNRRYGEANTALNWRVMSTAVTE